LKSLGLGLKRQSGNEVLGDLGKYAFNKAKDMAIDKAIDYGSSKGKEFLKENFGFSLLRNSSPKQ
jgi:hypothetical protein